MFDNFSLETEPVPTLCPKAHIFRVARLWSPWALGGWTRKPCLISKPLLSLPANPMKRPTRVSNPTGSPGLVTHLSAVLWTPPVRQCCCLVAYTEHTFCQKEHFFPVDTVHLGSIPFRSFLWQIQHIMFIWVTLKCFLGSKVLYFPPRDVNLARAVLTTVTLAARMMGHRGGINRCLLSDYTDNEPTIIPQLKATIHL